MPAMVKVASLLLLLLVATGCTTTYVPISWGLGDKTKSLSRSQPFLAALFDRYDPERRTLGVSGSSFDQVMTPSQVEYHLGAYRADTGIIYRNLYKSYSDEQLCDLMLHELAHHVWHKGMSQQQRDRWQAHLAQHPSPLQSFVRRAYPHGYDYDGEDFAFTVEYARGLDIEALAAIMVITPAERDAILSGRNARSPAFLPKNPSLPNHPAPQTAARSKTEKDGMPPHESD